MDQLKFLALCAIAGLSFAQTWVPRTSGTTASMRGVSAVNSNIVWASGTGGTFLISTDGGANWRVGTVPGAADLDFRDIQAFDANTAVLLSSAPGEKSRIYKTNDAGAHWALLYTNPDAKGFYDAISFWDPKHAIVLGDPVNGHFTILTSDDGGVHWTRQKLPPALPNEGAFAASGTCLVTMGKSEVWFGTGGPGAARVFHSKNGGKTWTVATTPIRNDGAAAGVFSLAFSDSHHGMAVGGDYNKASEALHNTAITSDGGRTWASPAAGPKGYRSAVAYVRDRHMWIAAGPSGSDVSYDNGKTWSRFDTGGYNAIAFVSSKTGVAVGAKGAIATFQVK